MDTLTICLCSAKGGTGKTAIAASLAVFLADVGKRVMVVDADAATSGMTLLMLRSLVSDAKKRGVVGLFDEGLPKPAKISERLRFIPASSSMRDTTQAVGNLVEAHLDYVKRAFEGDTDVIIIDAQAGTEEFARMAVEIADRVVIVTEFDPLSSAAVKRLQASCPEAWPPGQTYIVVNKMLPELSKIQSEYFTAWDHLPPIPFDFEVMRAYVRGEIPVNFEKPSQFVRAIVRMTVALLPELQQDMQTWFSKQTEVLKRPALAQLEELDGTISRIEEELVMARADARVAYDYRGRYTRLIRVGTSVTVAAIGSCMVVAGSWMWAAERGTTALMLLVSGALVMVTGAFYWLYEYQKRRKLDVLVQERAFMRARALEHELNRLLQEKEKLQSLLATEPKEQFLTEAE